MSILTKKKKDLPDFWLVYEALFDRKSDATLERQRFVILDTETTGFDFRRDRILSIGALTLVGRRIEVRDSFEIYLEQEHYNQRSAEVHCILKNTKKPCLTEREAMKQLLAYLDNAVLVCHHTYFDLNMLNKALKRQDLPPLKNQTLDTALLYPKTLLDSPLLPRKEHYTLDELAEKFEISKKDRHTALGDAYITAIAFLKILAELRKKGISSLKKLIQEQHS